MCPCWVVAAYMTNGNYSSLNSVHCSLISENCRRNCLFLLQQFLLDQSSATLQIRVLEVEWKCEVKHIMNTLDLYLPVMPGKFRLNDDTLHTEPKHYTKVCDLFIFALSQLRTIARCMKKKKSHCLNVMHKFCCCRKMCRLNPVQRKPPTLLQEGPIPRNCLRRKVLLQSLIAQLLT